VKYSIGVDPDSDKMGVAIYIDGRLDSLNNWRIVDFVGWLISCDGDIEVAIEDVMSNQFVYTRNQRSSKAAQSKVAMHVGRCQQNQVELQRWLDHYGIDYKLFKPQRGNWAKDKSIFEKLTGWSGRSNEETRSASFFGFKII
jgi:hypothetical protein